MPAATPLPASSLLPARPYRLAAVGGSAGGIPALQELLSCLPADFPVPIVVAQHLPADCESRLPEVLGFRTRLRCRWAEDGDRPLAGTVHVARPGANLLLTPAGEFLNVRGPKPRLGWPSVDLLLESMAALLGPEAIAVVLSGMLWDGAQGIAAVRRAGGATMVQHPHSASHPDMPSAAVDLGRADLMRSPTGIAQALEILAEHGVE